MSGNAKGIIVFDIDDTLLKADSSVIKIYKHLPDGTEVALSTEEFAKDEDIKDPSKKYWFDYRDFRDPIKVRNSILKGTPIIRNLKIMDAYINAGYDFCFLTARSCEKVVADALDEFLKVRVDGSLRKLGDAFKRSLSYAVNDDAAHEFPSNMRDDDKKSLVLRQLCDAYDKVVFVDDDDKNIKSAQALGIKNLTVIKAWK